MQVTKYIIWCKPQIKPHRTERSFSIGGTAPFSNPTRHRNLIWRPTAFRTDLVAIQPHYEYYILCI